MPQTAIPNANNLSLPRVPASSARAPSISPHSHHRSGHSSAAPLIWINGWPGVGKRSIAECLSGLIGPDRAIVVLNCNYNGTSNCHPETGQDEITSPFPQALPWRYSNNGSLPTTPECFGSANRAALDQRLRKMNRPYARGRIGRPRGTGTIADRKRQPKVKRNGEPRTRSTLVGDWRHITISSIRDYSRILSYYQSQHGHHTPLSLSPLSNVTVNNEVENAPDTQHTNSSKSVTASVGPKTTRKLSVKSTSNEILSTLISPLGDGTAETTDNAKPVFQLYSNGDRLESPTLTNSLFMPSQTEYFPPFLCGSTMPNFSSTINYQTKSIESEMSGKMINEGHFQSHQDTIPTNMTLFEARAKMSDYVRLKRRPNSLCAIPNASFLDWPVSFTDPQQWSPQSRLLVEAGPETPRSLTSGTTFSKFPGAASRTSSSSSTWSGPETGGSMHQGTRPASCRPGYYTVAGSSFSPISSCCSFEYCDRCQKPQRPERDYQMYSSKAKQSGRVPQRPHPVSFHLSFRAEKNSEPFSTRRKENRRSQPIPLVLPVLQESQLEQSRLQPSAFQQRTESKLLLGMNDFSNGEPTHILSDPPTPHSATTSQCRLPCNSQQKTTTTFTLETDGRSCQSEPPKSSKANPDVGKLINAKKNQRVEEARGNAASSGIRMDQKHTTGENPGYDKVVNSSSQNLAVTCRPVSEPSSGRALEINSSNPAHGDKAKAVRTIHSGGQAPRPPLLRTGMQRVMVSGMTSLRQAGVPLSLKNTMSALSSPESIISSKFSPPVSPQSLVPLPPSLTRAQALSDDNPSRATQRQKAIVLYVIPPGLRTTTIIITDCQTADIDGANAANSFRNAAQMAGRPFVAVTLECSGDETARRVRSLERTCCNGTIPALGGSGPKSKIREVGVALSVRRGRRLFRFGDNIQEKQTSRRSSIGAVTLGGTMSLDAILRDERARSNSVSVLSDGSELKSLQSPDGPVQDKCGDGEIWSDEKGLIKMLTLDVTNLSAIDAAGKICQFVSDANSRCCFSSDALS